MKIEISDNIVESSECTEQELVEILAVALYQREKISIRQAAELVGVRYHEFGEVMKRHDVDMLYDSTDLDADIDTLTKLDSKTGGE